VRTIVLTAGVDRTDLLEAVRLGARGIVLKESAASVLLECLRCVIRGQYWLWKNRVESVIEIAQQLQQPDASSPACRYRLTPRELETVTHVALGESNRDIAEQFSVREDTVKHHLLNIFDKLGVHSRLELAVFAMNHGLVDQPRGKTS
jgi:DNA-binding NarL/FixJ family response regulator